jgi:glycosyltransferase involved in cell wall biosynthesis
MILESPMRVLHVSSGLDPVAGGTASAVSGLARAQRAAGLDVRVVATWVSHPGAETVAQLEAAGVPVRSIRARDPMSRHPQLGAIVDELVRDADVVHVHALWESIQHHAAAACRRRGIPYVISPHGMLDPWNMTKGTLKKRLYLAWRMRGHLDRAAAAHYATTIERDWVARLALRAPAIVEPLGIDAAEFEALPSRGALRAPFPQWDERPVILFLGRVHRGKGLEVLVPALARMARRDAVLAIAGPDSFGYRAEVERMVATHDVGDRVGFTGMLRGPERVAALVDADVLALPSFHENFGLAAAEAMAAGTPVVVSDQVCLHGDVTAAGAGGVVPVDAGRLAAELDHWLGDDALRRDAGARARAFALDRYDWRRIAGRWVDHYQHLTAAAVPGHAHH